LSCRGHRSELKVTEGIRFSLTKSESEIRKNWVRPVGWRDLKEKCVTCIYLFIMTSLNDTSCKVVGATSSEGCYSHIMTPCIDDYGKCILCVSR